MKNDISYETILVEKDYERLESVQMNRIKQVSICFQKTINVFKNNCESYFTFFAISLLSFLIHVFIFQCIYAGIHQQKVSKKFPKTVSMKIHNQSYYIKKPDTIDKKKVKDTVKKTQKVRKKKLSNHHLKLIGKQNFKKNGHFPALIISYKDPERYIKDLYSLGAITVLLNRRNNEIKRVDLLKKKLLKMNPKTLNHYSSLKRVIRDNCWNMDKKQYARQLSVSSNEIEFIVLLPDQIEYLWMGHQIYLFKKHGLKVSDIVSVEGKFCNKKLKIRRVILFSGKQRSIVDLNGV